MANAIRIEHYIDSFEQDRGLRVSTLARHLIVLSLDAIEREPNPNWDAQAETLESYTDSLTRDVPRLLSAIAEVSHIEKEITYFNVLHFLSRNLKSICPFPSE